MSPQREEYVDFVKPFFIQSGFSIVMKKPSSKDNTFKFVHVFETEVWVIIYVIIMSTGLLVWLFEKFSPYSYINRRATSPKRKFTLQESLWFAISSFTSAGGGEPPRSVSARLLVIIYWVFVSLILATFTATLATLLTVERMETALQSLEQLTDQNDITYTVMNGSSGQAHLENMKLAEEEIFKMWMNLSLGREDITKASLRVWDYPMKEFRTKLFLHAEETGFISSVDEGFRRAIEEPNFAFIHDALEVRYKVLRDCNLTEIGEWFAVQPFAVALQKGSLLHEEISELMFQLQNENFFDILYNKYWKKTGPCLNNNDGTSVEAIGGVFITTFAALILVFGTLLIEIVVDNYKFKENLERGEIPGKNQEIYVTPTVVSLPAHHRRKLSSSMYPSNFFW